MALKLPVAQAVVGSGEEGCVVTTSRGVVCWHDGASGARTIEGVSEADEVVGDAKLGCARSGGQILCWGKRMEAFGFGVSVKGEHVAVPIDFGATAAAATVFRSRDLASDAEAPSDASTDASSDAR